MHSNIEILEIDHVKGSGFNDFEKLLVKGITSFIQVMGTPLLYLYSFLEIQIRLCVRQERINDTQR